MKQLTLLIILVICYLETAIAFPIANNGRFRPFEAVGKTRSDLLWKEQINSRSPLSIDQFEYQALELAGGPLRALPTREGRGIWAPLNALLITTKTPSSKTDHPIDNFTLYSDALFKALQVEWRKGSPDIKKMSALLDEGYLTLEGVEYKPGLYYPKKTQLELEELYFTLPLLPIALGLYLIAAVALLYSSRIGLLLTLLAFGLHTAILTMRILILQRPPVANMFETVVYVPWIGVIAGVTFFLLRRQKLALLSAITASIILLTLLKVTSLDQSMENVQAVLHSQFWLTIHVLLVVGSYGILIFSGVLAHFFLLGKRSAHATSTLLQSLYLGTGMLIGGTLLGGVWAAQSWGRFWDWDPKESWAFISACLYLSIIHAYRFRKIRDFGLAIGAIIGLMSISFTWYGVNYILGTGLHSYGFGSGGVGYYYLYIGIEIAFIGLCIIHQRDLDANKYFF